MPRRGALIDGVISYLTTDLSNFDTGAVLDSDYEYKKVNFTKGRALVSSPSNPIPVSAQNNARREIYSILISAEFRKKAKDNALFKDVIEGYREALHTAFDNNRATLWGKMADVSGIISTNFIRVSLGELSTEYAEDVGSAIVTAEIRVELMRSVA